MNLSAGMRNSGNTHPIYTPTNAFSPDILYPYSAANTAMNMGVDTVSQVLHNPVDISWLGEPAQIKKDTAIILEIPGEQSVREAVELAKIGYCPVPLFNGVASDKNAMEMVETNKICSELYNLSNPLSQLRIADDAPPVFMLDSRRKGERIFSKGTYDNRWNIYSQDMPSADFLHSHGIHHIILRMGDSTGILANDLQHVIYRYQENGITVSLHTGTTLLKVKPHSYKSTAYRLMTMFGLKRNSAGGFGAYVPEETHGGVYSSGSGSFGSYGRYGRYGRMG